MESAKQALIAQSKSDSAMSDSELQIPLDTARCMAQAISSKIKLNSTVMRENVTAMLTEYLVQNPSFLGVPLSSSRMLLMPWMQYTPAEKMSLQMDIFLLIGLEMVIR
jgi:hypothetical protein